MMDDYRYIEQPVKNAAKGGRPLLTWGFGDMLDDVPVLWSSDGYRVHMSWAFNFPDNQVPAFFPFAGSDFGCLFAGSKPPDYRSVIGTPGPFKMQVNGVALLNAVKPYARRHYVILRYTPEIVQNEGPEAAHAPATFELYFPKNGFDPETTVNVLPYLLAPAPSEPFQIGLDPRKLVDALNLPDDVKCWLVPSVKEGDFNPPLRVGEWGRCCAFVMPMTSPD